MSKDTNFDKHSTRFKKNIYDTDKGQLRLTQVINDLFKNTPVLKQNRQLKILDAGCGMGQVALALAEQGHDLTLCDISKDLLEIAEEKLNEINKQAVYLHSSLQQLDETHNNKYDLIIFHAVIEWLDQPHLIISELKKRLKSDGNLSLMFYNKNSIVFYNILKGNFRKILKQEFKGHPGGLTPVNPIDPSELDQWLKNEQFEIYSKTGIRVFYDYLSRDLKQSRTYEDILVMEQLYAEQSPFNMMGRYIHYICRLK